MYATKASCCDMTEGKVQRYLPCEKKLGEGIN